MLKAILDREDGHAHRVRSAAEPLTAGAFITEIQQHGVNLVVGETAAVHFHSGVAEDNAVERFAVRPLGRILLDDALLYVLLGVANLEEALVLRVQVFVGINHRVRLRALREELHVRHYRHRLID